jgi:predicted HAD superfamily Cof-like phosphohydrolase
VNNPIEMIRTFNTLAGNTDDQFNIRQAAMYMGLQCEELAEKLNNVAKAGTRLTQPYLLDIANELDALGVEFKRGTYDLEFTRVDRHAIMDDDIDLFVVTVGSLLSQGVDIHGAIAEVNRANMAKVWPDGTMHRDANGKIVKPEGWTAPDLTPFVCAD